MQDISDTDESSNDTIRPPRHPVRHHRDEYVALGAYTDCDMLLDKYLAEKTSRFQDFVVLWKETKFAAIFAGRESFAELLEFTEELLLIAKSFILPPHSQVKRIGGLYLMYGLYTQQLTQGHVKFRVSPLEWNIILNFVENLKAYGFLDANYIFHKMCLDGAFLTTALEREYGLERNYRKYMMFWPARDKELDPGCKFSVETVLSRVCRSSLVAMVDKSRLKYKKIKSALSEIPGTTFQAMEGTDADLQTVLLEEDRMKASVQDKTGATRRQLKAKAFGLGSTTRGGSNLSQVETASVEDPAIPSTSKGMYELESDLNDEPVTDDPDDPDYSKKSKIQKISRKGKKGKSSGSRNVREKCAPRNTDRKICQNELGLK